MNGLPVLLLLILIAALPVILLFLWYRLIRFPISSGRFLLFLLGGATSMFIALILQSLIPALPDAAASSPLESLGPVLFNLFCRIAATEEAARVLIFLILFPLARHKGDVLWGSAAGLVAGLGFALVESASYGASDVWIALLRTVTSAPLHGACGARVGAAVSGLRDHPFPSLMRFLTAVVIHGMYNFMIRSSGIPAIMAILAALCALASSILSIRAGLKNGEAT
ncbi:MAG: PrsW family intramembrane metalloprotease [Treponema sp.]|jgi:RsiW-degrading membrane proteinase PrsW (M82 family)|nr:PrsW family intramembrane metalloprotease [Treponema sp.]